MQSTLIWGQGKARMASRDGRIDSWSLFYIITTGRMVFTCDNSRSLISGQQTCPGHSKQQSGNLGQEGRGVAGMSPGRRWPDVSALSRLSQLRLAFSEPPAAELEPQPPGAVNFGRHGDGADPQNVPHASHWWPTWNPPPETAGIAAESATLARTHCRSGPRPVRGPAPSA